MDVASDKRVCSICAWREKCVKRFKVNSNLLFDINCPDFTKDVKFVTKDPRQVELNFNCN